MAAKTTITTKKVSEGITPQATPTSTTQTPQLRGTINTISSGFAGGGYSSSSWKKHLRCIQFVNVVTRSHRRQRMPPITFTDADYQGVDQEQDDSMVITIELENFAVKKVLINQGSLVDIVY